MSYELTLHSQNEQTETMSATALGATAACLIFARVITAFYAPPAEEGRAIAIADEPEPRDLPVDLAAPLLSALSQSGGMSAKDLLKRLKADYPEITKKDVNSNLYKLLTKRVVLKDASACPIWSRV